MALSGVGWVLQFASIYFSPLSRLAQAYTEHAGRGLGENMEVCIPSPKTSYTANPDTKCGTTDSIYLLNERICKVILLSMWT